MESLTLEPSPDVAPAAISSVFRWMGSKRRVAPQVAALLQGSKAGPSTYYEPFLGGGSLFFALGPPRSVLSDINTDLINAWQVLQAKPTELHAAISALPPPEESYYRIRAQASDGLEPFSRAVRFLYLNRYCFNGLYRTNRRAEFNVPMGTATGGMPP